MNHVHGVTLTPGDAEFKKDCRKDVLDEYKLYGLDKRQFLGPERLKFGYFGKEKCKDSD